MTLRLIQDLVRLILDPARFRDWEEAWTATEGLWLREGGLWSHLLALQYKEFCGGCTALALVWAPWSALAGPGMVAWKALALGRTALVLVLAFVAMDRWFGRKAALWAALLLAVVPSGHAELSLMLWSNHVDSALVVLAALALSAPGTARPFWAGLVLGLGIWAGRTSLYGLAILPWLLWRDRDPRALLGLGLGLTPLLLPAAAGDGGDYRFLPPLSGNTLRELLTRQALLWDPRELGLRLFAGRPTLAWLALPMELAAFFGLWQAGRRAGVLVALMLAYALGFGLSPLPIPDIGPEGLPINTRYFAPWMLLLPLAAAAAGQARVAAPVLVVGLLSVAGLAGRAPTGVRLGELRPDDPARFAVMVAQRVDAAHLCRASSTDPVVSHGLGRACGVALGLQGRVDPEGLSPGARWGLGLVRADQDPPPLDEAALDAELAGGLAQGLGLRLGRQLLGPFAVPPDKSRRAPPPDPRARVRAELAWLRQGSAPEAPCPLCAAAGSGIAESCGAFSPRLPPELELCVADALRAAGPDREAVAFGLGLALARRRDEGLGRALGQKLGPAFLAGFEHPAAGLDVRVRE